ncbi:IclR family transcriptional regulator [Muricoccus radiodurans]|uniref:IclR family transcriptional regulator n=1 Tax=Muricoccus radiodurans TaxID=2231721 RepID=UPI003CF6672C
MTESRSTPAAVKSARRTVEALELFAETHRPASVSEMARHLGAPLSSTSVLLAGLARLGYLEQDPVDRRYHPTLRVMLLGGWLQDRLLGEGSLLRLMEDLRARTGLTVLIGLQRGAAVQYILALRRPSAEGSERMRAGVLRPITRAAVGRALLMNQPEREVARILRRANAEEMDPARRLPAARLLEELGRSRDRGWAESAGAVRAGLSVLAMPLPPLPDQPPLAIGLGGECAAVETGRRSLIRALRDVCDLLAEETVRAAARGRPPADAGRG